MRLPLLFTSATLPHLYTLPKLDQIVLTLPPVLLLGHALLHGVVQMQATGFRNGFGYRVVVDVFENFGVGVEMGFILHDMVGVG